VLAAGMTMLTAWAVFVFLFRPVPVAARAVTTP
jgi:hypothetical protein